MNFRFSTQFQMNVGPNISRNINDAQWFGNFADDAGVTHYSFAHLDQRTVSMSTRLNYTVTPNLTFEFYGAAVRIDGHVLGRARGQRDAGRRAVRGPLHALHAAAHREAVVQVHAAAHERGRAVGVPPGSTLFVVWTHGRQDDTNQNPGQSWSRDYRDLFGLHPDNTFLVKLAYWLNR